MDRAHREQPSQAVTHVAAPVGPVTPSDGAARAYRAGLMVGPVLIFDLDGTLFRTETVTVPSTTEAFQRHGLAAPTPEEIVSFIGRTAAEYNAWVASRAPASSAERIVRDAAERELALIGPRGRLYAGVADVLRTLRARAARMAVCSNGSQRYVEAVLAQKSIHELFDAVRWRQPGDEHKPQMLGELLAELDAVGATGVVIGDRDDDVQAARAHGLCSIGCTYGYARTGELDAADALAASAPQVPSLVERLLPHAGGHASG